MLETARMFLSLAFGFWAVSVGVRVGQLQAARKQTFYHLAFAIFLALSAFVLASRPEGLTP